MEIMVKFSSDVKKSKNVPPRGTLRLSYPPSKYWLFSDFTAQIKCGYEKRFVHNKSL